MIPWEGGVDGDGWIYETLQTALGTWAAIKRCDARPTNETTALSGGTDHASCFAFAACDGGRLEYCIYDGTHGTWPTQPDADALIWAFFGSLAP